MAFRLKTYIKVLERSVHDSKNLLLTEDSTRIEIKDEIEQSTNPAFSFHKIFTQEHQVIHFLIHFLQEEIYHTICPQNSIKSVLGGIGVGFISYGQSGAGKSYMLFGEDNGPERGLAQRSVTDILKIMAEGNLNYELYASVCQIYVEQITDLAMRHNETVPSRLRP